MKYILKKEFPGYKVGDIVEDDNRGILCMSSADGCYLKADKYPEWFEKYYLPVQSMDPHARFRKAMAEGKIVYQNCGKTRNGGDWRSRGSCDYFFDPPEHYMIGGVDCPIQPPAEFLVKHGVELTGCIVETGFIAYFVGDYADSCYNSIMSDVRDQTTPCVYSKTYKFWEVRKTNRIPAIPAEWQRLIDAEASRKHIGVPQSGSMRMYFSTWGFSKPVLLETLMKYNKPENFYIEGIDIPKRPTDEWCAAHNCTLVGSCEVPKLHEHFVTESCASVIQDTNQAIIDWIKRAYKGRRWQVTLNAKQHAKQHAKPKTVSRYAKYRQAIADGKNVYWLSVVEANLMQLQSGKDHWGETDHSFDDRLFIEGEDIPMKPDVERLSAKGFELIGTCDVIKSGDKRQYVAADYFDILTPSFDYSAHADFKGRRWQVRAITKSTALPAYIPFTYNTVPKPLMVKSKCGNYTWNAWSFGNTNVGLGSPGVQSSNLYSYKWLFENCTMLDGSPCGIQVVS